MKRLRRKLYLWWRRLRGHDTEHFAPHGIRIHIPAHADTEIRYYLSKGGPYEEPEAQMVRQWVQHGQNVVELGGCFGVVSAIIRQAIGPGAMHIVVEADATLAAVCAQNAAIGAAPGRSVIVAAAVDYSGQPTVTFQGGHNAHVGKVSAGGSGIAVPAITLRSLTDRLPPGPFALVCDIEGTETALFAAEGDLMPRISVLVLETHPHVYPAGMTDLATMVARITDSGLRKVAEVDQVMCFVRAVA